MKSFLLFFIIIIAISVDAQNLITVQNGNNTKFYSTISLAISGSIDGDTIYIPGGNYNDIPTINKRLTIIGNGHNPNSALPGLITQISSLTLASDASSGSVMGLKVSSIFFQAGQVVTDYNISRCRLDYIYITSLVSGLVVSESIIEINLHQNNTIPANNCAFFNNIIGGKINGSLTNNSIFKNNIFLFENYNNGNYSAHSSNSTYENNIFLGSDPSRSPVLGTSLLVNNNLFVNNWSTSYCNCLGVNNINNQNQVSIFINQSGNVFNYAHDYHLQPNSPGKNAGTDGTDIGIYGGLFPWKDGSAPFNPKILLKSIANTTDQNGNLKINFKVKAQNH